MKKKKENKNLIQKSTVNRSNGSKRRKWKNKSREGEEKTRNESKQ